MPVPDNAIAALDRLLAQAFDALDAIAQTGADVNLVALLTRCENATRRLDRTTVSTVAALERRGVFAEKGYKSSAAALADLLGWEGREARRRVVAAEHVTARVGLDGAPLPARLPATATVFADGRASLRHVEVIARVLDTTPAGDFPPEYGRAPSPRRRQGRATTPLASCRRGVPRWSRRSTRTAPSPTTGRRRRSTSCT